VSKELVSVIVPVYNGEEFLADALSSIRAQDYQPVETIVVDDGSTDSSAAIAERFPEVVLLRCEHGGPAAARNAGLQVARGAYIGFLDADDIASPNKLSLQVAYLRRNPDAGCVLAHQEVVVREGLTPPPWVDRWRELAQAGVPDSLDGLLTIIQPLSAVLRRDVALAAGPFDASLTPSDDFDWIIRVRDLGIRIDAIPDVVMTRRVHGNNITVPGGNDPLMMARLLQRSVQRRRGSAATRS
jgi:glycosyltransferase involved in cell wall biosynthesis